MTRGPYSPRTSYQSLTDLADNALTKHPPSCWQPAVDLGQDGPAVRLLRADMVEMAPVLWAWPGFLPLGMLTILGGAPGCGKTTIALSLAGTVTSGGTWPDGAHCEAPGDVLIWSGEDPPEIATARLLAAGADLTRVHFVGRVTGEGERAFDPGSDIELLEREASRLNAPRLLILDPIVSAVSGDSHQGSQVRRSLQPVVDLAQRLKCAVLGITHFSKGTSGRDPVERVTGSIAFAALARLVLVAAKVKSEGDGSTEPRRVLVRAKSNIGPDTGGFEYSLERFEVVPGIEGQCVRWGAAVEGTAHTILADADEAPPEGEAKDAIDFLRSLLTEGAVAARTVFAEANGAGYSKDQMHRAARRLSVDKRKTGMAGGWVWALASEGGEGCRLQSVPSSRSSVPSSRVQPQQSQDWETF